jgi:hypothetical protein
MLCISGRQCRHICMHFDFRPKFMWWQLVKHTKSETILFGRWIKPIANPSLTDWQQKLRDETFRIKNELA